MPPPAFHWPTVCGCGPLQRELFPRPGFSITPEAGRKEPRLWVRRVMIWRDHEHVTRDIRLRPGLNIICSPDAGTSETAPIEHGEAHYFLCRRAGEVTVRISAPLDLLALTLSVGQGMGPGHGQRG